MLITHCWLFSIQVRVYIQKLQRFIKKNFKFFPLIFTFRIFVGVVGFSTFSFPIIYYIFAEIQKSFFSVALLHLEILH